jgi:hypothetical protein
MILQKLETWENIYTLFPSWYASMLSRCLTRYNSLHFREVTSEAVWRSHNHVINHSQISLIKLYLIQTDISSVKKWNKLFIKGYCFLGCTAVCFGTRLADAAKRAFWSVAHCLSR